MKPRDLSAARRYARALLDVANEKKEDAAVIAADLSAIAGAYDSHAGLQAALRHPGLPAERKRRLLMALAPKAHPRVGVLLDLLTGRQRTELLPALSAAYQRLWNQQRGVMPAEAVTAVPLEPASRDALAKALGKATGLTVDLTAAEDPALLGGVLVRMGGRTYDGSVQARLAALRARLHGAA